MDGNPPPFVRVLPRSRCEGRRSKVKPHCPAVILQTSCQIRSGCLNGSSARVECEGRAFTRGGLQSSCTVHSNLARQIDLNGLGPWPANRRAEVSSALAGLGDAPDVRNLVGRAENDGGQVGGHPSRPAPLFNVHERLRVGRRVRAVVSPPADYERPFKRISPAAVSRKPHRS